LRQIGLRKYCSGRLAPAEKKLGVGLQVTALAHLHVRNLAHRLDSICGPRQHFCQSLFLIKLSFFKGKAGNQSRSQLEARNCVLDQ
jgi:hypothetical protein